jgi:tetratricopeptide (TPR) repeat protein
MPDGWDESTTLDVLTRRLNLLRRLEESPAHKRDLIDDLDTSRSTLDRAVSELEEASLVERGGDGVALTASGRLALEWFERFQRGFDDVVDAEEVLAPLSQASDVDADVVVGAEALLATEPASYRPLERFHAALEDAERYRAVLPSLDDPRHVRLLYEHVVTGDRPAEFVVTPELLRTLREEFPRRTSVMGETDGFDLHVGDVPPYALALVEPPADRGPTVYLLVFTESGAVHGSIVNRTPAAVRWAEDRFAAVRDAADPGTDALTADPDGGVLDPDGGQARAAIGRSLPVSLEREGFVDLDVSYFRDEPVADPTTAWRAGLSLPEVHTGYAVERSVEAADGARSDDAPDSLTGLLRERLEAGENCVLLGPPGSGKSTTCKQVACGWYDDGLGSVLYRQNGRGRPLDSVEDLSMAVELADGHALVVVEDAVRPDTAEVLEAVERLGDREDVSFLLDARAHEWQQPPGDVPTPEGLSVETMPAFDDADTEALVDHFERTVGSTVDLPVERLRQEVSQEAASADESAPDEVLLLLHRLSTYADPLADDRTSLEDAVADLYDDVADDDLLRDVCVLANVLNAAGLPVDPGLLYAVADADAFDAVDDAVERLEGRLLFRREDGTYRTVHESWSGAFLEHLVESLGEDGAAARFGTIVTALLSLADDPGTCDRIGARRGEFLTGGPRREDPGTWVDETVEAVYAMGRERPKLAPLFGDGEEDTIDLPDACSRSVADERPVWLGEMFVAAGSYDRAERAFERVSDRPVDRLLGLSRVHAERGEYERAADLARECLEAVADTDRPTAEGRAHRQLGKTLSERGEYEEADDHYQSAIERFRADGARRHLADTLTKVGQDAYRQRDYDRAREVLQRSLDIVRDLGDRLGEAKVLNDLALVDRERGEYDRARERHERSLWLARALGDRTQEMIDLNNLGIVSDLQGHTGRAEEYFQQSIEISRTIGHRRMEMNSRGNLGRLAEERGEYGRALEHYRECLEAARAIGNRHGEALTLRNVGQVARRRGAYDEARDKLERALDLCEQLGDSQGRANAFRNLGSLALREGRLEAAEEWFREAFDVADGIDHLRETTLSRCGLAAVARERGEYAAAREHLERSSDRLDDAEDPLVCGRIQLSRARVALETDDPDGARELAERSRETFDGAGKDHWSARSRRLVGRVAGADGDLERGREQLQSALETFERVGAPQDALPTLRELVQTCREASDDESARDWCRRAETLLSEAPDPVADRHREWVGDCPGAVSEA